MKNWESKGFVQDHSVCKEQSEREIELSAFGSRDDS